MSIFPSLKPILFSLIYLIIILYLPYFRNAQFRFLFPFLIGFFAFFLFLTFILFIFFPHKVFLFFIPNSLFSFSLRILVSYITIKFIIFNSGQIVKLCSNVWVFSCGDIVNWISIISLHWFLLFLGNLDLYSFYLLYGNSLFIFRLFIFFQLFKLIFV